MANKLHKSYSNFTLKRLHQLGGYGSIFERDYTTISPMPKLVNGQISIYGSPTFKMSVRKGLDYKKKYSYGEWLLNNGNMFWTLDNIQNVNKSENKIEIKSDALDLKAFSCYGSALELIDKSIYDIISKFPAELYLSDKELNLIDCEEINGKIVNNPFKINIVKTDTSKSYNVEDIRLFCKSFDKYVIIDEAGNETPVTSWNSDITNNSCLINGTLVSTVSINDIIIKAYFYEDDLILVHNSNQKLSIRPNQDYQKKFFDNLDDFEKILLNKDTNYTSRFKTIKETNEGYSESIESYKWPKEKENNWNLDIEGIPYKEYISKLSKLGSIYDELYCDNIYRSMTHESIINLDNTGLNLYSEKEYDNSKIIKILRVIGRQIDEIKRYADSIKNSRNISYDGNGNLPDYFLKNELSLSGWESVSLFKDYDDNIKTSNIYPSRVIGFSPYESNIEFMKRLRINSRYIMRGKGTKMAIESLLSLFGFHSINYLRKSGLCNDENLKSAYEITEYVYVANGYNENTDVKNVKKYNELKDSFYEDVEVENEYNQYAGIPVAEIIDENNNGYLIPWFDKEQEYDGNIYFQSNGNWCEKTSNGTQLVNDIKELYSIKNQFLDKNKFYYVSSEDKYYMLKDKNLSFNENGWTSEDSFNDEQKKLLEAEKSIISINKGNNPHSGNYDNGLNYMNSYTKLFKNSTFNNIVLTDNDSKIINSVGFSLEKQIDNQKCHFFGVTDDNGNIENKPLRSSNLKPHNLINNENGNFDEISATSIINDKSINIRFSNEYKDFIEKYVIFYLKQIIPSTALFSYDFGEVSCVEKEIEYNAVINEAVSVKKGKINDII